MIILFLVYPFEEAPKEYKNLSTNGGDEDWIIVCDYEYSQKYDFKWGEYLADRLAVSDYEYHHYKKYGNDHILEVYITNHG